MYYVDAQVVSRSINNSLTKNKATNLFNTFWYDELTLFYPLVLLKNCLGQRFPVYCSAHVGNEIQFYTIDADSMDETCDVSAIKLLHVLTTFCNIRTFKYHYFVKL